MILEDIRPSLPMVGPIRYSSIAMSIFSFVMITYYTRHIGRKAIYCGVIGTFGWLSLFELIYYFTGVAYENWNWMDYDQVGWYIFNSALALITAKLDKRSLFCYSIFAASMLVWVFVFSLDVNYIQTEPIRWDIEMINAFTKSIFALAFTLQYRSSGKHDKFKTCSRRASEDSRTLQLQGTAGSVRKGIHR